MTPSTIGCVEKSNGNPSSAEFGAVPELVFLLDGARRFQPFLAGLDASYGDVLAQEVARAPKDLARHTRRIFHARDQLDSDALYGALLDLFLTLGRSGNNLRARLLSGVQSHLTDAQAQALAAWQESGRPPPDLPISPASVLAENIEGVVDLVHIYRTARETNAPEGEKVNRVDES